MGLRATLSDTVHTLDLFRHDERGHFPARALTRILFAALACVSCASAPRPVQMRSTCGVVSGASLFANFDSSQVALLTGRFRLTELNTADSARGKIYSSVTTLELHATSPVERAQIDRRTASSRDVRLVGTSKGIADDLSENAEVHSGFIVLGCADCYDGRSTLLQVQRLDATGFQGTWRIGQGGNFRMLQTNEMPTSEPAGRFCAERIASNPKR